MTTTIRVYKTSEDPAFKFMNSINSFWNRLFFGGNYHRFHDTPL
jgi:hypothetical protein